MPIEKSEGVILKSFNWSESSRTVVFFTRRFGKLPLVDKGGRSFKSKRGRLMPFTRIDLTFYASEKESSGYLSDIEPLHEFSFEHEGTLGRLAYGSAACELCYVLLPQEHAQPDLYDYFLTYLDHIDQSDRRALPALFLTFFLRLISHLGYHPSLSFCAGCGKELEKILNEENQAGNDPISFGPERGGIVCAACKRAGEYYIPLPAAEVRRMSKLQRASLHEAAVEFMGYEDATRLLDALMKFLQYHAGVGADLKSLDFLEKLKRTQIG
ncbi:MAG: DNA repair protein RecO [candidate division Zixibacteria bacterium]|nr:DNA repair protein RecO [candidate division Zixibacteria bacterium]